MKWTPNATWGSAAGDAGIKFQRTPYLQKMSHDYCGLHQSNAKGSKADLQQCPVREATGLNWIKEKIGL
jgi:hypothetical protein